jgi:hypothetical protein
LCEWGRISFFSSSSSPVGFFRFPDTLHRPMRLDETRAQVSCCPFSPWCGEEIEDVASFSHVIHTTTKSVPSSDFFLLFSQFTQIWRDEQFIVWRRVSHTLHHHAKVVRFPLTIQ